VNVVQVLAPSGARSLAERSKCLVARGICSLLVAVDGKLAGAGQKVGSETTSRRVGFYIMTRLFSLPNTRDGHAGYVVTKGCRRMVVRFSGSGVSAAKKADIER